ncbi:flagellar basal body-associated protein FliL [Bradyrhizobium prioriisuperbiae]|uniref:flagellar basal body-associated protein FliL n=1 Tax=Bradyrhizobium prioriisuperbiae TaxID=2854389 RepID=UPI0028EA14F5|nr:flagellar basal body-associated protein FliL [Bradyrhizobium prioritasuperba]
MADDQTDEGAAEGSAPKTKFKLIIAVVGVFAILCGGASYYFLFMRQKAEEKHAEAAAVPKPPVFVDVPEVLVNLSNLPGERVQYLKVKIALEVKDSPVVAQIQPSMPRLLDIFQTYLRELRIGDLQGSAGMFRLKEELTRRVNAAIQPNQVNAVLFKEIIVQ